MIRSLAYADDLCIVGSTKDGINQMLEMTTAFFKWAGLDLYVDPCQ